VVDEKLKVLEPADTRLNLEDLSRKRQGRGRGRNSSGRGRGKKSDQIRSASSAVVVPSNGHIDIHYLLVLRCFHYLHVYTLLLSVSPILYQIV
jgi:hypothetical protein